MEELRIIGEQIAPHVPCAANMTENCGRPLLTTDELFRMGFKVILYPLTALMTAAAALESTFAELNSQGTTRRIAERMWPPTKFKRLIGADDLLALKSRLGEGGMISGLHHVAVLTADIDAAVAQYVALLGGQTPRQVLVDRPGVKLKSAMLPLGKDRGDVSPDHPADRGTGRRRAATRRRRRPV